MLFLTIIARTAIWSLRGAIASLLSFVSYAYMAYEHGGVVRPIQVWGQNVGNAFINALPTDWQATAGVLGFDGNVVSLVFLAASFFVVLLIEENVKAMIRTIRGKP